MFGYDAYECQLSTDVQVVGIGDGGDNVIKCLKKRGFLFETLSITTHGMTVHHSKADQVLEIGRDIVNGLSAKGDPKLGHACAISSRVEIEEVLSNDKKLIVIVAGLGGGTGTGALPVVTRIAQQNHCLVIPVVTTPFNIEGPKKQVLAKNGLAQIKKELDCVLHINHQLLITDTKIPIVHWFQYADDVLCQIIESITFPLVVPGLVNIDFVDMIDFFRDLISPWVSVSRISASASLTQSVDNSLHVNQITIINPSKAYLHIAVSPNLKISSDSLEQFVELVENKLGCKNILWSISFDESLNEDVKVTLIAPGVEPDLCDDF